MLQVMIVTPKEGPLKQLFDEKLRESAREVVDLGRVAAIEFLTSTSFQLLSRASLIFPSDLSG